MTNQEIDTIRARYNDSIQEDWEFAHSDLIFEGIPTLLSEVERLQAECDSKEQYTIELYNRAKVAEAEATKLRDTNEALENSLINAEMNLSLMTDEVSTLTKALDTAYSHANNAIYFDDSSDYRSALYDVCKTIHPELEWDDFGTEYIAEKEENE